MTGRPRYFHRFVFMTLFSAFFLLALALVASTDTCEHSEHHGAEIDSHVLCP